MVLLLLHNRSTGLMFVVKIVLQETEPYLVRAIQHHSIMEDIEQRRKDRQQISRWSSVLNRPFYSCVISCLVFE